VTLLINATIDGLVYYISNELVALENQFYDDYVLKISSVKYSTPTKHGGYARLTYSDLSLSPQLFPEDSWPPPKEIQICARYTDNDGLNSIGLFDSTAHRSSFTRTSVEYRLYGSSYSEVLTSQAFSGTLVSIFETYTGSTHLNLQLDSTLARDPSPAVVYTASGELLDVLSDIAAFFSHMFYIDGETLYLVDLKGTSPRFSTAEDEFLEGAKYRDDVPYRIFTAGNYYVAGSYPYGDEVDISPVCHDTQANIETALEDIKRIYEKQEIEVSYPMDRANIKTLGTNLRWYDESLRFETRIDMGIRSITYNFDKEEFAVSGEGEAVLSS
jgi:hypothetical protein